MIGFQPTDEHWNCATLLFFIFQMTPELRLSLYHTYAEGAARVPAPSRAGKKMTRIYKKASVVLFVKHLPLLMPLNPPFAGLL